jgi:periplasmic protein TonB
MKRRSTSHPGWSPGLLAQAAVYTLTLFLVVPWVSGLNRRVDEALWRVQPVDDVTLPPPVIPELPPVDPARTEVLEPIRVEVPQPPDVPAAPAPDTLPADWLVAGLQGGDFQVALGSGAWDVRGAVFGLADVDQGPVGVLQPPPLYPQRARRQGIEGAVELEFVVRVDGGVEQVRVVDSQPGSVFDAAAIEAVSRWRFEPAVRAGEAVAVRVRMPLSFRLER